MLRSALAVPLEASGEVTGVLALYRGERDAFSSADLGVLTAVSTRVSLTLERAMEPHVSVENKILTDLPGVRELFVEMQRELNAALPREGLLRSFFYN